MKYFSNVRVYWEALNFPQRVHLKNSFNSVLAIYDPIVMNHEAFYALPQHFANILGIFLERQQTTFS